MKRVASSPQRPLGPILLLIVGLLWLGGTFVFLITGVVIAIIPAFSGDAGGMGSSLVTLGCSLVIDIPFILIGLVLVGFGLRPFIARAKVAAPEVALSSDTLRVGEEFFLDYRQLFKSAVEVKAMTYELVWRERATYHRGTNTYTATHEEVVQRETGMGRRYEAGETLVERRRFQIPENAMHTFAAMHNQVHWCLKAQVELSGWADFNDEYVLNVLPEKI